LSEKPQMTVLADHIHTFGRAMQERHGMRLHKMAAQAHQGAKPSISRSFLLVSFFDGLLY